MLGAALAKMERARRTTTVYLANMVMRMNDEA
jgi:hypothetical protein